MIMKKKYCVLTVFLCIFLTACGNSTSNMTKEQGEQTMYEQITPQQAKELMESYPDAVILDVREQDEYDSGHIKNAILIPHTEIKTQANEKLPDKNQLILVYCRSGRRSKIASESLVNLGYTNVKEFGGINDWPYGVE